MPQWEPTITKARKRTMESHERSVEIDDRLVCSYNIGLSCAHRVTTQNNRKYSAYQGVIRIKYLLVIFHKPGGRVSYLLVCSRRSRVVNYCVCS